MKDRDYLLQTVRLARPYARQVAPKPAVGALLVKDGKVLARAIYTNPRGPHAEVQALKQVGSRAEGATLYVSLEPCTFWKGKLTTSCAEAIARSKVARVVVGMYDPRLEVNGKGIAILRRSGKKVKFINVAEARKLFAPYLLWLKRRGEEYHNPYVLMKTAMSIDGKIAAIDGRCILISNIQDARAVQRLRAEADAILVGGHTLLHDNPRLTVRESKLIAMRVRKGLPLQPINAAIISNAQHLKTTGRFFTEGSWRKVIFTTNATSSAKIKELKRGADVFVSNNRRVNLKNVMRILWNYGARRVLLEGGGTLNFEMIKHRLVDELRVAIAPIVIGGRDTKTLVEGGGFLSGFFPKFEFRKVEALGGQVVLWYRRVK